MNKNNGFTLIETLIAMTMIALVVVAILGGFSQVQLSTRQVGDRNLAMVLAESRMEEMLKFPGSALTATTTIDYTVKTANSFLPPANTDPSKKGQFKRTTTVTEETVAGVGTLMNVRVMVEYAYDSAKYPVRVSLNSRRGG